MEEMEEDGEMEEEVAMEEDGGDGGGGSVEMAQPCFCF